MTELIYPTIIKMAYSGSDDEMHSYHNDIIGDIIELAKKPDCKKRYIRRLLKKYNIDISYHNNAILDRFSYAKHWEGVRYCLELGADPQDITGSDLMQDIDEWHIFSLNSIFLSFGHTCEWNIGNMEDYQVDCDEESD